MKRRVTRATVIGLALMFVLAACSADSSSSDAAVEERSSSAALAAERAAVAPGGTNGSADSAVAEEEQAQSGGAITATGLTGSQGQELVIRDAHVEIRVEEFDTAWDAVRRVAGTVGGFVADASTSTETIGEETYSNGTVTLRIPSTHFDAVLDDIGALGERLSQSVTGSDVSEEYVDLEARLRHWSRVEEFTLVLMDEAATIKDSLIIQDRLGEIQLTIEQIEGRLRFLDDRTSFSTVAVAMTAAPPAPAPVEPVDPNPITEAFGQAVDVILAVLSLLIVAMAFVLPFSVIALFGIGAYRLVRRLRQPAAQT